MDETKTNNATNSNKLNVILIFNKSNLWKRQTRVDQLKSVYFYSLTHTDTTRDTHTLTKSQTEIYYLYTYTHANPNVTLKLCTQTNKAKRSSSPVAVPFSNKKKIVTNSEHVNKIIKGFHY